MYTAQLGGRLTCIQLSWEEGQHVYSSAGRKANMYTAQLGGRLTCIQLSWEEG